MADIELVIKISKDSYNATCNGCMLPPDVANVVNAIRNGTPLPKGHGDLIDRSEVIKSLFDYHKGQKTIGQCIDDVQTIIEADEESEGI